jgi:hypothetical protein
MLDALGSLQALLLLILAALAMGADIFAFVDALRQKPQAFTAAGKLTKQLWLLISGVAAAVGFIFFVVQLNTPGSLAVFNFVNLIALVAAGVYLADVRPAVRSISGGGNSGPYGGW